jgi:predicted ABC-type ATPase
LAATFLVIAGPNGAGKSSFTSSKSFEFPVFDADLIASKIDKPPAQRLLMTGRILHAKIEEHFLQGTSFGVETTLSGQSVFSAMGRAKLAGMRVVLHYISLDQLELSKLRVILRVKQGGHGVPERDLERRFMRSVVNLHRASSLVDEGYVYDNSGKSGFRLLAEKTDGHWVIIDRSMPWLTDGLAGGP